MENTNRKHRFRAIIERLNTSLANTNNTIINNNNIQQYCFCEMGHTYSAFPLPTSSNSLFSVSFEMFLGRRDCVLSLCLVVFAEQGWILYKVLKPTANFVTTSHVSSDPVRFQVQQKRWQNLCFAKPFRKWRSPLYLHVCKIGADWNLNRNHAHSISWAAPDQYFLS